jgi:hypothetical protein
MLTGLAIFAFAGAGAALGATGRAIVAFRCARNKNSFAGGAGLTAACSYDIRMLAGLALVAVCK